MNTSTKEASIPSKFYLLLYPTLWALFLAAGGLPDLKLFVIFVLGVVKLWQVRPTLGKRIQRCQKTCNNCQLNGQSIGHQY
jgi:hypothetical protein